MNPDSQEHLRAALSEGCREELDRTIGALTDARTALVEGKARVALGCFLGAPERLHYLAIILPRLAQLPELPVAEPEVTR